jgi:NAD(P)-dependent dehydrogenase (short-subunit alcohol dehydrogenase family)
MPTVLVTGANRGIGLEFARQYSTAGWKVIATARNPQNATELSSLAKAKNDVEVYPLDITSDKSVRELAAAVKGKPIDLLINNSAIYPRKGTNFGELDYAAWRDVMDTNVFGALRVTEALFPNLEAGQRKQIASITSTMGSIKNVFKEVSGAGSGYYQYRTSKAALNIAMAVLAQQLRTKGFSVVVLCPGWVQTDMGGTGAAITPQQSVSGMRKILEKDPGEISGKFLSYDGAARDW